MTTLESNNTYDVMLKSVKRKHFGLQFADQFLFTFVMISSLISKDLIPLSTSLSVFGCSGMSTKSMFAR